jgi:hypothetical protein
MHSQACDAADLRIKIGGCNDENCRSSIFPESVALAQRRERPAASHDQLREPAIGPIHALRPRGRTTTIAPSFTRFTRSMMSSLVMRMQPDEMAWPIYSGWLGTVDAVQGVLVAPVKVERPRAQRISRTSGMRSGRRFWRRIEHRPRGFLPPQMPPLPAPPRSPVLRHEAPYPAGHRATSHEGNLNPGASRRAQS